MKISIRILLLMILLTCISCDAIKPVYKIDNSCPAPCWKGLNIGMRYEDASKIVNQMKGYDVEEKLGLEGSTRIVLKTRGGELSVLSFSDRLLIGMDFSYNKYLMKLPLSEVIKTYGDPDYAIVWFAGRPINDINAVICYPERGITIDLESIKASDNLNEFNYFFHENMNVEGILYDILQTDKSGFAWNDCKEPLDIALKHDWVGYGEYQACDPQTNEFCEQ